MVENSRIFARIMTKGSSILITGASGFIGSFIVEGALERGFRTWAGMRAGSSKAYLQDERISFCMLERTTFFAPSAAVSVISKLIKCGSMPYFSIMEI